MNRFHQSLLGELHVTSQRKQTLTIMEIYWQLNMFTGRSKAETLGTSKMQTSKEQPKNMIKQLVMKIHVAVAQATEMSRAEMWEIMGSVGNQVEET